MADYKKTLKDVWNFIWHEDSLASWLVNIVLAFILIKFIVYPGLGFALGTTHPVVAVVSGSMEHDGSFDDWWSSDAICEGQICNQEDFYSGLGISKTDFEGFRFHNGFNTGDIIVLKGTPPSDLEVGDVIVFQGGKVEPIIHRIVKRWEVNGKSYFQTKGDHNPQSISAGSLTETNISEDKVIGEARFRLPYLGWIKIVFTSILRLFSLP